MDFPSSEILKVRVPKCRRSEILKCQYLYGPYDSKGHVALDLRIHDFTSQRFQHREWCKFTKCMGFGPMITNHRYVEEMAIKKVSAYRVAGGYGFWESILAVKFKASPIVNLGRPFRKIEHRGIWNQLVWRLHKYEIPKFHIGAPGHDLRSHGAMERSCTKAESVSIVHRIIFAWS